jgi:ATP-dependent Clp protease adaptor protein ClpS
MSHHPTERPAAAGTPGFRGHTRFQEKPKPRRLPTYKVILQNCAAADLTFVVRTVMELTRFCKAEATYKMWQAYHCGRSLLLVTYKERAELYVEQFASKGLTVTIEPA